MFLLFLNENVIQGAILPDLFNIHEFEDFDESN